MHTHSLHTCTLNHILRLFLPHPTPLCLLSLSLPLFPLFSSNPIIPDHPISNHHSFLSLKTRRMIRNPQFPFPSLVFFFTLLFISHFNVSSATSAVTAVLRDQVPCTMCSACDNPCQPILSPPPPSPPLPSPPPPSAESNCPPPPSPPTPEIYNSPPPPLPPSVPTVVYYSPPPPYGGGGGGFYPPPTGGGGGGFYPPPTGSNFPTPAPPNAIFPYCPFYYCNPPPSPFSNSSPLAKNTFVSSILLFLIMSFIL